MAVFLRKQPHALRAVFQTAVRYAHRTTFRCARFALASKLARSLLSESTHRSIQSIFHNLLNLPC